jgi:hypothetical protein
MKSYLRDNPTIAFGLGLPLLLVIVFLLISGIPSLLVKPPQYDVLYVTDYEGYRNTVQISVVDQKASVIYQTDAYNRNSTPRLWRYNPKTGAVREIPIIFPPRLARSEEDSISSEDLSKTTVLDVPDLDGLAIDSFSIAPDGYEFNAGEDRYSRNVFGRMFYSSRYGYEAALTKKGRSIRIANSSQRYYGRDIQFIGWVVSQ